MLKEHFSGWLRTGSKKNEWARNRGERERKRLDGKMRLTINNRYNCIERDEGVKKGRGIRISPRSEKDGEMEIGN